MKERPDLYYVKNNCNVFVILESYKLINVTIS